MSDPLLTSLCVICHIKPPQYKCPRCGARTCSLVCVKKHKNWSSCNGERDPTVYIPPVKLRTDAGIDHDYNFLTKIERTIERAEKALTEERGIALPSQNAPPPNKLRRLNKGQSRGNVTMGDGSRPWARSAIRRLKALGISVKHVPMGMTRERENTTSYNKRTNTVNWQVEWLLLCPRSDGEGLSLLRLVCKTLDHIPLNVGFAGCQEEHRRTQLSQTEKKRDSRHTRHQRRKDGDNDDTQDTFAGQNMNSVWRTAPLPIQDTVTGTWERAVHADRRTPREKLADQVKRKYHFYFHVPGTPSREPQKLIELEPTDSLGTVLSGLEVLEYPTIYVVPIGVKLPDGYILAKKPEKAPEQKPRKQGSSESRKRKGSTLVGYGSSDEEEGQVVEGQGEESEPGFEFDDGKAVRAFLEDDDTSSSGLDSD
ncbi:uncharacterized protein BCR38DRAFT_451534 [Pseudomassariella vexata]|uniref:Box C/D snoRNA protein 1 n=1 Tax=Pseudomassariella vexata TaxID=1141098 RepID=A0A1Y2DAF5_9PEZI|nr:uncharacterized protein BCR38DRAFT_451534 [Pseudomassariella vexata]ORY56134.1 hypothetical protein BCR38DRAFT_451534 [Pseudomassariella vexata]